MHLGHWRWGGAEVINHERLAAYLENGIKPMGAQIDVPDVCDGVGAAIDGTGPYRTPLLDQAPWVDDDDPDTYDFAGVMALEVTGADDTTRTVDMVPTVRDGARAGRARRGPRTMAVSALLLGSTTEGVNAGLSWLQRVLSGDCAGLDADCGPTALLEMLTSCPGPIVPTIDTTTPASTVSYDTVPYNPADGWSAYGGSFDFYDETPVRILRPYDVTDTIDGGDADDDEDDTIDGGGAGGPDGETIDGGGAETDGAVTLAVGPYQSCNDGPITITWYLADYAGDANAQLVIVDTAGAVVEYGPKVLLEDEDPVAYEWELPFGVLEDDWRPGVMTGTVIVPTRVEVTQHGVLPLIDCVNPYRRLLPRTATTSGPVVVDTIEMGCVQALQVEWVWVSGGPYRYRPPKAVLVGLDLGEDPSLAAPGVTYGSAGEGIPATPWNCAPPTPQVACAFDPCAPGFGTAPVLPFIPSTAATITTQNINDLWVCVGPEQVPANDGVFTINLTPETAIVGARVRVYDTALGDCTVPDVCDFAYEYLIDYIPEDGVFTINGMTEGFTTLCDGGAVLVDSGTVVRGDYGGPTKVPVARCDRRYLIRVQWLSVYPRTCEGLYDAGDEQGNLSVSVTVSTREG